MSQEQINKAKETLSLIPQIFYDVIARIIPGLIIMVVVYFIYLPEIPVATKLIRVLHWFSSSDSPNIFIFFSLILNSYIISVVIGQLAVIFEKLFRKLLDGQVDKIKEEVTNDFNKIFSTKIRVDNFPSIAIMYDYVRLYEQGAGNRLVKLRAEVHMCRNILFGLLLIAFVTSIIRYKGYNVLSLFDFFIITLALISFIITYYKRRKSYIWGLCNHWILIEGYHHLSRYTGSANQTKSIKNNTNIVSRD